MCSPSGTLASPHGNVAVEELQACLWGQADREFEVRLCHVPAGEGARESCASPRPLPLALCPEAGLEVHPVGSCPGPGANGGHWQVTGEGGE